MLRIELQQWDDLRGRRNEQLKEVVAEELMSKYPDANVSRDELVIQLRPVFATAEKLQLHTAPLILRHALLSKALGLDYFVAIPFVGAVLSNRELDDEFKLIWLEKWAAATEKSLASRVGA